MQQFDNLTPKQAFAFAGIWLAIMWLGCVLIEATA